jgi:hypothetical protein
MLMKFFIKTVVVVSGLSFVENDSDVVIFEKVYLHLDRHFYLSGDDIWFKAYLVDAQTNKPSSSGGTGKSFDGYNKQYRSRRKF